MHPGWIFGLVAVLSCVGLTIATRRWWPVFYVGALAWWIVTPFMPRCPEYLDGPMYFVSGSVFFLTLPWFKIIAARRRERMRGEFAPWYHHPERF